MADDEYGPPPGAMVLNQLCVVEYIDPNDSEIYKMDLSHSRDGDDLETSKYFELAEWARMFATAPLLAELVHDHVYGEDEDDE
jgi:hypothetical protein